VKEAGGRLTQKRSQRGSGEKAVSKEKRKSWNEIGGKGLNQKARPKKKMISIAKSSPGRKNYSTTALAARLDKQDKRL